MAVRACTVSFQDARGIRHGVDVEAESLYEAVVLAVRRFREDPWMAQVTQGTPLDIDVRAPATRHAVTLQQVEQWLATASSSPLEMSKKAKLKLILVQGGASLTPGAHGGGAENSHSTSSPRARRSSNP